jgi:hypothetical protein
MQFLLEKDNYLSLSNSWQQFDFSSVTRLDFHVLMFQKYQTTSEVWEDFASLKEYCIKSANISTSDFFGIKAMATQLHAQVWHSLNPQSFI